MKIMGKILKWIAVLNAVGALVLASNIENGFVAGAWANILCMVQIGLIWLSLAYFLWRNTEQSWSRERNRRRGIERSTDEERRKEYIRNTMAA